LKTIDSSVTGRRVRSGADPVVTYTVTEFARAHNISVAHFYALRKRGLGPREMVLGRRRLISVDAAADWRREREQATPE
jgi:hypothetical protein